MTAPQDSHTRFLSQACVISHNLEGVVVQQGAPARVTRNGLPLPDVVPMDGNVVPFVLATRFPGGKTFSITTIGRQLISGWIEPRAAVTIRLPVVPRNNVTIGVFGRYHSLTLEFEDVKTASERGGPMSVLAQDLAADSGRDVTSDVLWNGTSLTLPGSLIDEVCLVGRSREDDVSAPGLIVSLFGRPLNSW